MLRITYACMKTRVRSCRVYVRKVYISKSNKRFKEKEKRFYIAIVSGTAAGQDLDIIEFENEKWSMNRNWDSYI